MSPIMIARRGFLGRTVAALATAGAVNVTAIAATRPAAITPLEDPALIDAGHRLDALFDQYRSAHAAKLKAKALAETLVPDVPEALIFRQGNFLQNSSEEERDIEGRWLPTELVLCEDGKTRGVPPRRILNSERLRRAIRDDVFPCGGRTKLGREVKRLLVMAEEYEAARSEAIQQSGWLDADELCFGAHWAIDELARCISEMQPRTMAGAAVMARALNIYLETEGDDRKGWAVSILGQPLAEAVARLA